MNKVDDLIGNSKSTALKCLSSDISKVVLSGILNNNRKPDTFVADISKKVVNMCIYVFYMSGTNIRKSYLFILYE